MLEYFLPYLRKDKYYNLYNKVAVKFKTHIKRTTIVESQVFCISFSSWFVLLFSSWIFEVHIIQIKEKLHWRRKTTEEKTIDSEFVWQRIIIINLNERGPTYQSVFKRERGHKRQEVRNLILFVGLEWENEKKKLN